MRAKRRRSLPLPASLTAASSLIIRSFCCCTNCPESEVSCANDKSSSRVHWAGRKDFLESGIHASRNGSVHTPLNIRGNLLSRKAAICSQSLKYSTRKSITAFENPGAHPRPLKLELDTALRTKVHPKFKFPFPSFIHLDTFGGPKTPIRVRERRPELPEDTSSGGYREGIRRARIRRM